VAFQKPPKCGERGGIKYGIVHQSYLTCFVIFPIEPPIKIIILAFVAYSPRRQNWWRYQNKYLCICHDDRKKKIECIQECSVVKLFTSLMFTALVTKQIHKHIYTLSVGDLRHKLHLT